MPLISGWQLRALSISVFLSIGGYALFTLWGGWGAVVEALQRIEMLDIVVLLALSLVNYALRFQRWHGYLQRLRHTVPWRFNLHAYLTGFALTTTPGKAGEALRGRAEWVIHQHISYMNEGKSVAAFPTSCDSLPRALVRTRYR